MGEWDDMITTMLMHAPDPNEPIPISNRKATIYGATIPFLLAALTAAFLRLWVRFRILRDPGWDDFFVIIAVVLNIAANILVLISVNYGLGRHYLYLGVPNMTMYIKLFYFENAVYITQTVVIKISLLLQYLRIFKAGTMRWICIALLVIISTWGFAYSFMAWVPCFPVKAFWRRQDFPNSKCYGFGFNSGADFSAVFESHTALNMVFDLTIFLTPMVLFSTPNLRTKSVIAMAGIFMIGAVVVFTSAWRLYTIVASKAATYPYIDFTWWTPISIILSCLEIDLAMMCASMPVFWPVVEKSFSAIFVTHEVHVIEHRRSSSHGDLEYELEHAGSGVGRQDSLKSDSGHSRTSLTRETTREGLIGHYKDQYVIGQVDPFANEDEAITGPLRVETNVDSKPKPKWKI